MRNFFIGFIKWMILLTALVGLVLVGLRYYKNRQIIFSFVGDQNNYYSEAADEIPFAIGYCDRPAAWSIYAPISFKDGQGPYQLVKFADNAALWNALATNKIAFALVSLDQYALHGAQHNAHLLTAYAVSTAKDGIVCAKSWQSKSAGQVRRVACVNDSTSEYIAQNLVNKYLDSDSTPVEIVATPDAASAQELLLSGQVEALATCEPSLSKLQSQGYELVPDWEAPPLTEVVAIKSWGNAKHTLAHFQPHAEFIANWLYRYSLQHNSMGPLYSIIARTGGLKAQDVRAALDGLHFVSLQEIIQPANLGLQMQLKTMLEFWMMNCGTEAPFTETTATPRELLAPPILMRALARYIPANDLPSAPSVRSELRDTKTSDQANTPEAETKPSEQLSSETDDASASPSSANREQAAAEDSTRETDADSGATIPTEKAPSGIREPFTVPHSNSNAATKPRSTAESTGDRSNSELTSPPSPTTPETKAQYSAEDRELFPEVTDNAPPPVIAPEP